MATRWGMRRSVLMAAFALPSLALVLIGGCTVDTGSGTGGTPTSTSTTPTNGGTSAAKAADQARALVAQGATASSAVQALFQDAEWAPGPVGEWAGDCVKLPYAAWYFATNGSVQIAKGNAIDNYNHYKAQVHLGAPPLGAVTFYDKTAGNPLGHTALSLGDGTVATTTGLDGQHTANAITPYLSASSGAYLGYYMPG
jgi:hypothetical protein